MNFDAVFGYALHDIYKYSFKPNYIKYLNRYILPHTIIFFEFRQNVVGYL